ncbi:Hydroxyproline-rich glycoprotein family protein [Heracleum sosnowskyi]|uniref:Hydroxyproline-rich glycoprotein family protein n=1 Tax=Heracleum sosnowskyi TaxID=360622 RepID=A0AAD8MI99_9APIA|nr:Hydroxyproline-rich glycoprotein family protein [Heracleum sosnowskyi]
MSNKAVKQTPIRPKYRPIAPKLKPQQPLIFPGYSPRPMCETVHVIRPTTHLHNLQGASVVTGLPISSNPNVSASSSSILDRNAYKDISRDITWADSFVTVRDRKATITEGVPLYAQCRSWLRNGIPEERQPQYLEGVKSLPRPLPIPVGDIQSANIEDGVKEGEDEGEVEHLSSKQLLQRHIKRSIKVRARLREERQQKIARYKTRLALLFPAIVKQQFRCDKATGT